MDLISYLKFNEGCRLTAYQDHLGVWTVGYGQTGKKVVKGVTITMAEAEAMLERSANLASDAACRVVGPGVWVALSDVRRMVLSDMAYQMGEVGLSKFVRTLSAIREGRYADAALFMSKSLWAKQTPARAARNAGMMLSGVVWKP
jgi:lysozyme